MGYTGGRGSIYYCIYNIYLFLVGRNHCNCFFPISNDKHKLRYVNIVEQGEGVSYDLREILIRFFLLYNLFKFKNLRRSPKSSVENHLKKPDVYRRHNHRLTYVFYLTVIFKRVFGWRTRARLPATSADLSIKVRKNVEAAAVIFV